MRPTPLLLLLACSCQDYRFWPGQDDPTEQEPESGAPVDTAGPGGHAGPGPLIDLPTPDTGPPPCPPDPLPALAYEGEPSCTPMPEEHSWELNLELTISSSDGAYGSPVVIPGADGRTLIVAEGANLGYRGLLGYDGATGERVFVIRTDVGDADGSTVFRGSAPGSRDLYGTVNDVGRERLAIINVDQETVTGSQGQHHNWTTAARDIDHDGAVELVTGSYTAELDGVVITTFADTLFTMAPTVADVFGDGREQLFNATGWSFMDGRIGARWAGLNDISVVYRYFEGAPVLYRGAVVFAGQDGHSHFVADLDGVARWVLPPFDGDTEGDSEGSPALGDLDGDAEPELVTHYKEFTVTRDLDGEPLWTVLSSVSDVWNGGSVAMADLDADGVYEVIDWGSRGLMVIRGSDGAILARDDRIATSYIVMPPVIADVDGDGSAEIVVIGRPGDGQDTQNDRIYVFGAAEGRWARTRPVWNQIGYDVTSVRDDGTVPAFPRPNFDTYNSLRAQPAHDGHHPDLEIQVLETCRDEEAGTVAVHAVVHNRGSRDAPEGAVVRLMSWSEDSGTGLQDVASHTIPAPIPSMTSAESVVFEVTTEQWATRQVLQVDGAHDDECDWVNDRVDVWEEE